MAVSVKSVSGSEKEVIVVGEVDGKEVRVRVPKVAYIEALSKQGEFRTPKERNAAQNRAAEELLVAEEAAPTPVATSILRGIAAAIEEAPPPEEAKPMRPIEELLKPKDRKAKRREELTAMTRAELMDLAKEKGVELPTDKYVLKHEIVNAILKAEGF